MEYIQRNDIHALSIKAFTPEEWERDKKLDVTFKVYDGKVSSYWSDKPPSGEVTISGAKKCSATYLICFNFAEEPVEVSNVHLRDIRILRWNY